MRITLLVLALLPALAQANLVTIDFSGVWGESCRYVNSGSTLLCNEQAGLLREGDAFSGQFMYEEGVKGFRSVSWSTMPDTATLPADPYAGVSAGADGFHFASISVDAPSSSSPFCGEAGYAGPLTHYVLTISPSQIVVHCREQNWVDWSYALASNVYVGVESAEVIPASDVAAPEPRLLFLLMSLALILVATRRRSRKI